MSESGAEPAGKLEEARRRLSRAELAALMARDKWLRQAFAPRGPNRDTTGKQIPPDGNWLTLIFRSGRGFGKTRAEVEWLWHEMWRLPNLIGHAVGPTISDMHGTLMLGPAGFRACVPAECLKGGSWEQAWTQQHNTIQFSNGSIIRGFGATDGGSKLRGPQCHAAIADELREWDKPAGMLKEGFENLEYGVRLRYPDGSASRIVAGTTPKPIPFLKGLYRAKNTLVVTGSTYENVHNLSESFKQRILPKEGTQSGRVEIHAEDIDADENAIFKRSWIRLWPKDKALPEFMFLMIVIDPATSEQDFNVEKQERDPTGIAVFGVFNTKQCFTEAELRRQSVSSQYAALLCDYETEMLGFPELLEKVREKYRTKWGGDGYSKPGRRADLVLIEAEKTGISLRQSLVKYNVPTWPFNPHGQSKTMRAHAASPLVLQGMLWVPESKLPELRGMPRDWAEPFVEQLCTFAGEGSTPHDEAVDCATSGLLTLMHKNILTAVPQWRQLPDPDEEDDRRTREAVAIAEREKRARRGNPYGV